MIYSLKSEIVKGSLTSGNQCGIAEVGLFFLRNKNSKLSCSRKYGSKHDISNRPHQKHQIASGHKRQNVAF